MFIMRVNLIAIMMLTSNKDFERSNKVKVGYYIGVQSLFSAPIFHPKKINVALLKW